MSATPTDPNLQLLKTARDQISSGDLKKAALTLNKATALWPEDPRVYLLGGLMAEKSGNIKSAFDALRKSLTLSPGWGPGMLELALLLARQNQFQEAIEWAERVAAQEPSNLQVLAGVVDIAHRAGHTAMAVRHLQRGLLLVPGDLKLRRLLARDLGNMGRAEESMAAWTALIDQNPADALSRTGRVQTLMHLGRMPEAAPDTQALLSSAPDDAVYQYYDAIAHGRTPPHQPVALVRHVFDAMAGVYDQHMVRGLHYQLPKKVADMLIAEHPDKHFNVLDLGCGTGLLGVRLGRIDGFLIGVDISLPMIDQAARHQVYDKFHNVDILDALQNTPESQYEVMTALDVFDYVGDLEKVIPDALRILTAGGQLIFSCEETSETGPDLVLLSTDRYAHKRSHVQTLCEKAGFAKIEIESLDLRLENNEPVKGYWVRATKAA